MDANSKAGVRLVPYEMMRLIRGLVLRISLFSSLLVPFPIIRPNPLI